MIHGTRKLDSFIYTGINNFKKAYSTIQKACKRANLRCLRADDIWEEGELIQDIFSLIYRSKVVISDFTNRNSNVFYETGIAHTLGKPVIPILQNEQDVPFDLKHIRYIQYLNNGEGRAELEEQLVSRLIYLTKNR